MAELTAASVRSLLGVLRNEVALLARVGHDVDIIKEEMEVMNSFLEHLARTAPPGGEHDELVRTWMRQIRNAAQDCSNIIERYLQSGDLAIHRARGGPRRYFWWTYWPVRKMIAQHRAAIQLRELKERVRDVGMRRLRYSIEVPGFPAEALPGRGGANDQDVDTQVTAAVAKLGEWLDQQAKTTKTEGAAPSVSIVVPDPERGCAIADKAQGLAAAHSFLTTVRIKLPEVHYDLPLLTTELLSYILHDCEEDAQTHTYLDKRRLVLADMWKKADAYGYSVYRNISKLMTKVGDVEKMEAEKRTKLHAGDENNSFVSSKEPMAMSVLLQALWLINKEGQLPSRQDLKQWSSFDKVVKKTAEMLKEYMEKEYNGQGEIRLDDFQFEDILRNAYTKPASASKPEEEGSSGASATTAPSKGVTHNHNHKITLEIIGDLPADPKPPPPGPQPLQQLPPPVAQPLPPGTAENVEQQEAKGGGKDETKNGEACQKASTENKRTQLVIKGTVDMVTLDILGGGKDGSNNGSSARKSPSTGTQYAEIASAIKGAKAILSMIGWPIRVQLVRKGIVDMIKDKLKKGTKTLIILQDEKDYLSRNWEDTRQAFRLLGSSFAVIIFTTNNQKAKEYCYPLKIM